MTATQAGYIVNIKRLPKYIYYQLSVDLVHEGMVNAVSSLLASRTVPDKLFKIKENR